MSPFIAELSKLKNLQQGLDKNGNVLVEQISRVDNSFQISEFYKGNTSERILQEERLRNDVRRIVVPLRKINSSVRQENINNMDLKLVKKEMMDIQNDIQVMKNTTRTTLDLLKKEEDELLDEMQIFEQKVEDWSKPVKHFPKIYAPKKTSATTPENISPEVKEFMDFVAAGGGHENGWPVDDHNLFLKALNKTKDVVKLAEVLHALLPDISKEEIIAHDKWYHTYIDLKEKQKNSIQNWRNNKIKATNSPNSFDSKCERSLMKSYSDCIKKEQQQQKIAAWKAKKRAQMAKQYEQDAQKELRRKELEKQQKQKQEQLRAEVNNWRYSKQAEEEARKLRKAELELREQENKAATANRMIKLFQNQDELLIQKKMQLRQVAPKTPEVGVVNLKHEAPRDSQRLFKPTRQWIMRSYGNENSGSGNNKLSLQAIPKLGIPAWRKNIT